MKAIGSTRVEAAEVRKVGRLPRKRQRQWLSAIPEEIKQEIFTRGSTDETLRELLGWLKESHGVVVSRTSLSRFLRAERFRLEKIGADRAENLYAATRLLLLGCEKLASIEPIEARGLKAACFDAIARASSAGEVAAPAENGGSKL